MKDYSIKAMELFKEGYNCSQAVFSAFCEQTGMDFEASLKISSSFGGGMGRLREVCGAVSGMFLVAGMLHGYTDPKDLTGKALHYRLIQNMAERFKKENNSIICRELLGMAAGPNSPVPQIRTDAYYEKRPCIELVGTAARIVQEVIEENQQADA